MPISHDFQDSAYMFGDEAANVAVATAKPTNYYIPQQPSRRGKSLITTMRDWVSAIGGKITEIRHKARRQEAQVYAGLLSNAAKPVAAEELHYNEFGLPKPR